MSDIPGVADVQSSRQPGLPEMQVEVDRAKASSPGLNVSDIADTFKTAVGGRRSSMYRDQGDEYNIQVRLREPDRLAISQLGDVPLSTPGGETITADSVVHMRRREGPVSIGRHDQERIIVVTGSLAGRDLGSVISDLGAALRDSPPPDGYEYQ